MALRSSSRACSQTGVPGASRAAIERTLRLAEAEAFVDALPQGLATRIGGRGLALSDGQRQRLGLARLFLRDPRILVLDEAFSALDLATEQRVRAQLWRTFAGRSALVISHRALEPGEFDRVFLVREGRVEEVDPQPASPRPAPVPSSVPSSAPSSAASPAAP